MTRPSTGPANLFVSAIADTARKHREQGEIKEALALLELAVEQWPEHGRVRHQLGLAMFWNGDPTGLRHLLAAARQEPTDVERLADLGECLNTIGDRGGALVWFRRALVQAPIRADLIVRFGQFLLNGQQPSEAETWIR